MANKDALSKRAMNIISNPAGGKSTPIEPGLIARVSQGIRYAITGQSDWFGPMEPLTPVTSPQDQQSVAGRQFDYPVGYNTRVSPRQEEAVSFAQMRQLADGYDVMRLVIETRKDQVAKLRWKIAPKDQKATPDARCEEIQKFFALPDGEHTWAEWLRMITEDLLVIDAATLYVRPNLGGKIYALEPIDGATIKKVIDEHGRTPIAPEPAYQQILKGVPAINYTRDELIYKPRNIRTHKIYGYSPVEQVIMTVNIALRRQLHQLSYYTEGNIPEALVSVPKEWNPDQIDQFQRYWDSILEGDLSMRRRLKFIPDGLAYHETKAPPLKDEYDEWLARVVCFAFSIAPTPFVKQQNRATAGTAQEQSLQEGLIPIMEWIKSTIDYVIVKYFDQADIEFTWVEEEATDVLTQTEVQDKKVRNGTMTINESRALDGKEPIEGGDEPIIITSNGAIRLKDALEQAANPDPKADPNADPFKPAVEGVVKKAKKPLRSIDRNRDSLTKIEKMLKKAIQAFFDSQAPQIARQVIEAKDALGKSEIDDIRKILDALNFNDWVSIIDDIEPILEALAKEGGAEALAQIGMKDDESIVNLTNEQAVSWAQTRAAEWVGMKKDENGDLVPNPDAKWNISESTREMLNSTVTQAMEEGWSNDQLASAIEDCQGFSSERSEMIARTETAMADVQGNLMAYRESGQVEKKQWITGAECCDDCHELDGEIVDLDESFSNDGGDGPPLHPACRCDVLPILIDDREQDS